MLIPLQSCVEWGVQPGPTLHVGAHIGEEAEQYNRLGFSPVWWVEANGEVINELTNNVRKYNGQVIWAAVSDEPKTVRFHISNNRQSSSYLDLGTHAQHHPEVVYVGEMLIQATTVDTLFADGEIEQATYMSLDVQGTELDVLRGGEKFLQGVNAVYAEVNKTEVYVGNALVGEVTSWLAERGFTPRAVRWTPYDWGDALFVREGAL